MCGIFAVVNDHSHHAAKTTLEGLKRLEYRGYDSWGVAVVPNKIDDHNKGINCNTGRYLKIYLKNNKDKTQTPKGQMHSIVVKKKIGKIGSATVDDMPDGDVAIGHTRWATHGRVTDENAHPHLDCTGSIALIHNGIMENYEEAKHRLIKKGHRIISETDSEVVAHLIEEYAKSLSFQSAVTRAFNEMEGLNAIIVLDTKGQQLIVARNGSPLVLGFGNNAYFVASDVAALIPHTKRVYFLKDNEMAVVNSTGITVMDAVKNRPFEPKLQTLTWSVADTDRGKYPYFMLKEIYEEPKILTDIAGSGTALAQKYAPIIKKSSGSYLVGCGSASYVALAGSYLFSKIAGYHINTAIGSEFGYHLDFLTDKSLVVALSQSGETMDILQSVKKAKERHAKILAIVNVLGSTLYREADAKMLIGAGPEISVASTKAVTAKLAHLILLAFALAGEPDKGHLVVKQAAQSGALLLQPDSIARIQKLAHILKNVRHIYVIGRGLSYPASLETAMKIKEITYIHAEGMAAGELKHGPLALVEKGTPCIVFLPDDETYGANLAGAMEMKARGGYIIGISHKPHEVFDYFLPVADAKEGTIIPNIMTGQLLAYYLALARKLDPDMPRNLAKSVTVK